MWQVRQRLVLCLPCSCTVWMELQILELGRGEQAKHRWISGLLVSCLSEHSRSDHADVGWSVHLKHFLTIRGIKDFLTLNAVVNICLLLPLSVLISRVRFFKGGKYWPLCPDGDGGWFAAAGDQLCPSTELAAASSQALTFLPRLYGCPKEMYWPFCGSFGCFCTLSALLQKCEWNLQWIAWKWIFSSSVGFGSDGEICLLSILLFLCWKY